MTSFKLRTIANPPSLGEQLRLRREELGIKIESAAEETAIAKKYLTAIESGKLDELPGEIYAKSFLKVYAEYLNLYVPEVLSQYQSEKKIYIKTKKIKELNFSNPVRRISGLNLLVTPKIVRGGIVGVLALMCLVYLGFKLNGIVSPPKLEVWQPQNDLITEQSYIEIAGQIEKGSILAINGQQVLADPGGNFSETVDLQQGVNVIEIVAEKRHGTQTKVYRQVVVEDPADKTSLNNK